MKKKLTAALLAATLLASSASAIELCVDGRFSQDKPVMVNDRTLVPMRSLFESLGATVDWNAATNTATATKGATSVSVQLGSKTAYVNGTAKTMEVAAQSISNKTMVPIRFVSEAFNAKVWWEEDTETVYVATTDNYDGYRLAPKSIYTSEGESLIGTYLYTDGTVKGLTILDNGMDAAWIETADGNLALTSIPGDTVEWDKLKTGQKYRVCFLLASAGDATSQVAMGVLMEAIPYSELSSQNVNTFTSSSTPSTTPNKTNTTNTKPSSSTSNSSSTTTSKPSTTTPSKPSTSSGSSASSSSSSDQSGNKTVYVTKTGKRYHYSSSCNGGTYYKSTLTKAKSRGLTPCNKCVN